MVGMGHLGSTCLGGSVLYSYHRDPSVVTVVGASLSAFPFFLSVYHYDGCYLLMYFLILMISM